MFAFTPKEEAVFPDCPTAKNGYAYLNGKAGIGVDFDERNHDFRKRISQRHWKSPKT